MVVAVSRVQGAHVFPLRVQRTHRRGWFVDDQASSRRRCSHPDHGHGWRRHGLQSAHVLPTQQPHQPRMVGEMPRRSPVHFVARQPRGLGRRFPARGNIIPMVSAASRRSVELAQQRPVRLRTYARPTAPRTASGCVSDTRTALAQFGRGARRLVSRRRRWSHDLGPTASAIRPRSASLTKPLTSA